MSDYRPNTQAASNPFEFGITLIICIAVSSALAVLIAGVGYLYFR